MPAEPYQRFQFMPTEPWKKWIPGVLSKEQVNQLIDGGYIREISSRKQIDASSMDLVLGPEAWELTKGSVKPTGSSYKHFLDQQDLCKRLIPQPDGTFRLLAKHTYLFGIREKLFAAGLAQGRIYGQATAKSSIGRMDVLARLIVDGMRGYEGFDPDGLSQSSGDMYLEITPLTFHVLAKGGISLSQLRFFFGEPRISEIQGKELYQALLRGVGNPDGMLSVELHSTIINGHEVAAFSANEMKPEDPDALPLWKAETEEGKPDPCQFWRFLPADSNNRLQITKAAFYILRSKERIQLPKGVAVYCRAIDETIGEMRIHYAGFVHPFFGMNRADTQEGTQLIFE